MAVTRRWAVSAMAVAAAVALSGCGSAESISGEGESSSGSDDKTISIGSAGFAENEIIAELYAQALEDDGYTVDRTMQIGQRDVYISALKDGSIDLIPEYSGNLLQYYDDDSDASSNDEVYDALKEAVPEGFDVLSMADAENKDSYNVTEEFSDEHDVTSLKDLANVDEKIVVGGNPELKERPYGPKGLTKVYGVDEDNISFTAINDSGGSLTVGSLLDGKVNVADIFSTTPAIQEENLVTLDDPKHLILPQNVVPLINSDVATDDVTEIIDKVQSKLTTEDLIDMNARNQGKEKASPEAIAKDWLADEGIVS